MYRFFICRHVPKDDCCEQRIDPLRRHLHFFRVRVSKSPGKPESRCTYSSSFITIVLSCTHGYNGGCNSYIYTVSVTPFSIVLSSTSTSAKALTLFFCLHLSHRHRVINLNIIFNSFKTNTIFLIQSENP